VSFANNHLHAELLLSIENN